MDNCVYFWVPLIFVTTTLIISLLKNISYYVKEKKQKDFFHTHTLEMCIDKNPYLQAKMIPYFSYQRFIPHEELCQGKTYDNYQDYIPSNDEFYPEECPVYDNLNHHQDVLNESCYEQMSAHPQTTTHEIQPITERQMCYASLDHSVKRKQKHLRKKKYPTLEVDEDQLTRSSSMPSDSCIYLNSEQLNAENKGSEDATHEDPKRHLGFIHTKNDANF